MKRIIIDNMKIIVAVIISIIITAGGTAYAIASYNSMDISYKGKSVKDALDELYSIGSCDNNLIGTVWNFEYKGKEDFLILPCKGIYKFELWGAQGGISDNNYPGGYGGYSTGKMKINKDTKIYINVGGQGKVTSSAANQVAGGGYNGGGSGFNKPTAGIVVSGGGGATHIALASGLLADLEDNKKDILIVSGGGGTFICSGSSDCYYAYHTNQIGHAGGFNGVDSNGYILGTIGNESSGGLQDNPGINGSNKGTFGKGASVTNASDGIPGGGAGYYGGNSYFFTAGGGSSYISSKFLTDNYMYYYNCKESNEEKTKTIKTNGTNSSLDKTKCPNGYSNNPIEKCAKAGNGHVKIILESFE